MVLSLRARCYLISQTGREVINFHKKKILEVLLTHKGAKAEMLGAGLVNDRVTLTFYWSLTSLVSCN